MKCFLPICKRDKSVSLHRFPKKPALRQKWINSLSKALGDELSVICPNFERGLTCSKHFKPECFSLFGTRRRLQKTAVPTLFQKSNGTVIDTEPIKKQSTELALVSRQPTRCSVDNSKPSQVFYRTHRAQQTSDSLLVPPSVRVPQNWRKTCRLCFATDSLEPLYSGLIVVREEMLDRIYLCTGILIVPQSRESAYICADCERTIKTFFSFRQQVYSNNIAYLEKKVTDKAMAKKAMLKAYKRAQKLKIVNPSEGVPPKAVDPEPEPLQIELIENCVPEPPLEMIPNPLDCKQEIKPEPSDATVIEADPIQLNMTVEWDKEPVRESSSVFSLPEPEPWTCQRCGQRFPFKFECAKHMLQNHLETVETIKVQLDLNKLNTKLLEMISASLTV